MPLTAHIQIGALAVVLLVAISGGLGWWHGSSRRCAPSPLTMPTMRQPLSESGIPTLELIIEVNCRGEIQFLNEAAHNLLGVSPVGAGTASLFLTQLVCPAERARFGALFRAVLGGAIPSPQRWHLVGCAGRSLPVRGMAAPILGASGDEVVGMRAVFTDLRGELEFSQVLDQYRLVASTLDGILKTLTMAEDDEWSAALDAALTSLSQLVPLDSCSLLRLNVADSSISWEYRWGEHDAEKSGGQRRLTNLDDLPWLADRIAAGELVHIPNLDELPQEAVVEHTRWARMNVHSLLAVPMFVAGEVTGLMAFQTVQRPANWGSEGIRLLETITRMIASSWHQRQSASDQRAATQKLEDIIEFLPDATFVVNSKGSIVSWNQAMAQLTGKTRAEMLGQCNRAYALPLYGDRVPLLVDHFIDAALKEHGQHYHFVEMVGENLCGETFVPFLNEGQGAYLWCTASPLYDSGGQIVGAIESLRDVTYRKVAELALREGEERYRRLVETMNDGMGIVDEKGRVVFVNDRLCEMTGYAREDLLGCHVNRFVSDPVPDRLIEDWTGWSLDAGQAIEVELPCLDGTLLPVRLSPSALHTEEGVFQGGFAVVTDMTRIREAEIRYRQLNESLEKKVIENTAELLSANAALRQSESRYRRLIEALREGYVFYSRDTQGRYTYLSPSYRDVLGFDDMKATVACLRKAYAEPRNAVARRAAEKTALGYKQSPYELQLELGHGDQRVLTILEAPVFAGEGQLTSVEGIMHDVTEERRNSQLVGEAQTKLVEAEKLAALGGLMAGISHEINTPIGIGVTASSHLEQLNEQCEQAYLQGALTEHAFEDFLERSMESARLIQVNLSRAADLLANFKQVAADQSSGQERTFNLAEYFADIIQSLSPRFRHTGFRIRFECPSDLSMTCDPGVLYQILSNLILNSFNHGFEGMLVGEIVLSAHREGDEIVLEHRDNGVGMSKSQIARIYEPFFTTSRGRGGTGLGMHIVYNNVTQTLGGRIACASKLGKGTTFKIMVPLSAEVSHG